MLSVTISYQSIQPFTISFEGAIINETSEHLHIPLDRKNVLNIVHDHKDQYWLLTFAEELDLEKFEKINQFIKELKDFCEGTVINETDAFIGYLADGSKAFIYNQFSDWREFILKAKHCSMEGQKVEVYAGSEKIASGILVDYEVSEDSSFEIKSITLLTQFGEKVFENKNLSMQATGEFF